MKLQNAKVDFVVKKYEKFNGNFVYPESSNLGLLITVLTLMAKFCKENNFTIKFSAFFNVGINYYMPKIQILQKKINAF